MGKGDDSSQGAQEANRLSQQGIEELRRQFGLTEQNVQGATDTALGGIRQQFDQTAGNINPFIQAGQNQLESLQQGASIGGFGERLGQIFGGGALDPLIAERTRGAQFQQSATGLRRGDSLQDIAAIPQDIGLGIEQLLTGRSSQLAGQGLQAALGLGSLGNQASLGAGQLGVQSALGLGSLGAQNAGNIAGIFGQQGQNVFQGANQDAQRQADFFGDVLGLAGTVGGAFLGGPAGASIGGSLFGGGGGGGVGAGAGGGIGFGLRNDQGNFFSDRNLKENIEKIGDIGPLSLYQWDWIPETKDMLISKFPTMGFVADEVKKHFPEFVKDFYGFDSVNYSGLLDELQGVA